MEVGNSVGRPKIAIRNLSVSFVLSSGHVLALDDISLDVAPGGFVSLIGPSGCGKSTLLGVVAGLADTQTARISGDVSIDESHGNGALGFVFQRDTLLPWRTVLDNIAVGLEVRGISKKDRHTRARELISLVGLQGFELSFPHQLSGGMRQRVSIARALAYDPDVILMDEPFAALDSQTRLILQQQLLQLWYRTKKTIIFVTHDLSEAVILSERVVLMTPRPGRIREIYEVNVPHPRDALEVTTSTEYLDVYQRIWAVLRGEIREIMGR